MHPVKFRRLEYGWPGSSYVDAGGAVFLPPNSITGIEHTNTRAYIGPVEESKMAALNSDCAAGKRMCASALPAPADCNRNTKRENSIRDLGR